MMDILAGFLTGTAWAADAAAPVAAAAANGAATAPPPSSGSVLMQFLPLFLIFAVFYFLLIRPQQKKMDAQNAMLKDLKKGDRIITGAGFVGTITRVEGDDYVFVDIADGVQVKVVRATITGLVDPKYGEPAATATGDGKNDNKKK